MRNERLTDRLDEVTNKRRNIAVSEARKTYRRRTDLKACSSFLRAAQERGAGANGAEM